MRPTTLSYCVASVTSRIKSRMRRSRIGSALRSPFTSMIRQPGRTALLGSLQFHSAIKPTSSTTVTVSVLSSSSKPSSPPAVLSSQIVNVEGVVAGAVTGTESVHSARCGRAATTCATCFKCWISCRASSNDLACSCMHVSCCCTKPRNCATSATRRRSSGPCGLQLPCQLLMALGCLRTVDPCGVEASVEPEVASSSELNSGGARSTGTDSNSVSPRTTEGTSFSTKVERHVRNASDAARVCPAKL
mmetsp:Transcript_86705/g.240476  ORF Transcript_86705/g.240476 Transcript_86705/m.240476 type:complete len:247 (-) Transcript_86705:320-1060(-)